MFDFLKETIIGPNPEPWPWPKWPKWPKGDWDTKDVLIAALVFLMYLILTKGVVAGTALAMKSKKFGIAEDVLRTAAKDEPWA